VFGFYRSLKTKNKFDIGIRAHLDMPSHLHNLFRGNDICLEA